MSGESFLGLGPFQWLALIVAATVPLTLLDALVGHYRRAFAYRAQYAPFMVGGLLLAAALAAAMAPGLRWANQALQAAGWLAVVTGFVGAGYHFYYGTVKKPGGLGWWLHYAMYGAPWLAPLELTALGLLGLGAAWGLAGETSVLGLDLRQALLAVVAAALAGAILQVGILHYRGAFNNPVMYAPLTIPLLTMMTSLWMTVAPSGVARAILAVLLWLTFLTGFVGLGMHLRGLDRQMGGLYVALFNLLEGPPPSAPALFAALAAVGLLTVHLLL